ncbi:MAG: hypothetical protein AAGF12_23950 [Myxococcota bacterium]
MGWNRLAQGTRRALGIGVGEDEKPRDEKPREDDPRDDDEEVTPRGRIWRYLRVSAQLMVVLVVLGGVLSAVLWSRARGEVARQLHNFGQQMVDQRLLEMKEDEALSHERVLRLNGQPIIIHVGKFEGDSDDALSDLEAGGGACERVGGEDGSRSVSCFRSNQEQIFDPTDLSTLGDVEYRLAVDGDEDDDDSFYLDMKPGDGFDVTALAPDGINDVPGRDHEDIPRPPNASRVMSAYEEGRPYMVSMYLSKADETGEELMEWYRDRMSRDHWVEVDVAIDGDDKPVLWYRRVNDPTRFAVLTFSAPRNEDAHQGTMTVITEAQ